MSTPAREIAEKKAWEIVQRDFRREMHCGVMEVTAADLSGLEEAITAALTRSEEEKNALQDDLERIKVASGQDKPWCNADTVIEGIRHMRLVIESNRVDVAKYEAAQDSLSTLTARLKEAEEVARESFSAMNVWTATSAPEFCDEEHVKSARQKIHDAGGTIAYIADVSEKLRSFLTASTPVEKE